MANVSGLSGSVSGNTVTLTWNNPALPLSDCNPPGEAFPERTWKVYRDGSLIWSETRDANHASPNGRTSFSETVADGSYQYEVQLVDRFGLLIDQTCTTQTITGSRVGTQVDVNVVDTTPDPFTFTDLTNVGRGTTHFSNYITVTGIGGSTSISISGGGAQYQINDGPWTSANGTVEQGDVVRLKMTASSNFSTTVSTTLTIGGVSDTWSITTKADATAPLIYLPSSPPLSLRGDVQRLFGPYKTPFSDPAANLTEYVRGGAYVPDISANNAVPTAPPIDLLDLLGAAVEFKWTQEPSSKHEALTTVVGNFKQLSWNTSADAALSTQGLDDVEFRWTVTADQTHPKLSVSWWLSDNENNPLNIGTWIAGWQKLIVQGLLAQALQAGEVAFTNGTITLEARPKTNTSIVISATAGYSFSAADTS